jgi:hypothetical protein
MSRDWKYITYIGLLVLLLAYVLLSKTTQHDWRVTFSHLGDEPYGTSALNRLLPAFFDNQKITNSYKTLYELADSIRGENILIISSQFNPDKADTKLILEKVEQGSSVFISATYFYGALADTLGIRTADSFFQGSKSYTVNDSSSLHLSGIWADTTTRFMFRQGNIPIYFSRVDSVQASVLARNDYNQPVAIRIARGKGQLILNCTPMMFTNIYLLMDAHHQFVASLLSYLPEKPVYRTEFYHLGRMEAATPLRFILSNEPLRWAYYLTMIALILFIVFEAKRKQRIIPVIKPLANTTLEFITTIGNLYYQRGDHKNLAEKKIQYFFDYVHTHYALPTSKRDETFITLLARKSGKDAALVNELTLMIDRILASVRISEEELLQLNTQLEKFQSKN